MLNFLRSLTTAPNTEYAKLISRRRDESRALYLSLLKLFLAFLYSGQSTIQDFYQRHTNQRQCRNFKVNKMINDNVTLSIATFLYLEENCFSLIRVL